MMSIASTWQLLKPIAEQEREKIISYLITVQTTQLKETLQHQIKEQRALFEERRTSLEQQKNRKGADLVRKELLKAEEKAAQ